MNPDSTMTSVLLYWLVAGALSVFIFENTKLAGRADSTGFQTPSLVFRRLFYFMTGGFSLPFLLLALLLVSPVGMFADKKLNSKVKAEN